MISEPVNQAQVYEMLMRVDPCSWYRVQYGEIATAIAMASNHDPLFPGIREGCLKTAALLVAIAYHRSKFNPSLVRGKRMGLYQIEPPNSNIDGKLLLLAINASYIAIDLIRTSALGVNYECTKTAKTLESPVRMLTA